MPDPSRGPSTDAGPPPESLSPGEFAERFEASAGILWTLAAGVLGDRTQAEDALQEACVIALQKLHQFRPQTSFNAWMGRIVRFVALNHLRRRTRRRTSNEVSELMDLPATERATDGQITAVVGPRGELRADAGHFDDELLRALHELRPMARACLLLKVVSDLDYAQIGAVLGVPEGTAMSHVHRARRVLRERLSADGADARAIGGMQA